MSTTLISVEEYLRTSYEPDAEYVDGVLEERPMGEGKHSAWQITIGPSSSFAPASGTSASAQNSAPKPEPAVIVFPTWPS